MSERGIADRLWANVERGSDSDCWPFTGARTSDGYGSIWINGRVGYAHRISYRLFHGDPGGKMVLHHCDNPPCVNPRHLYLGGPRENLRDAEKRGLWNAYGENAPDAKLSRRDVVQVVERIEAGESNAAIAGDFSVVPDTIGKIRRGENWRRLLREIGYVARYEEAEGG